MGVWDDVGMTGTTMGKRGRHLDDGEDTTIMINMLAAICNFLCVCVNACMHVHVCACVCTCVGTPPYPPHYPPGPSPEPQGTQNTKFNKS